MDCGRFVVVCCGRILCVWIRKRRKELEIGGFRDWDVGVGVFCGW